MSKNFDKKPNIEERMLNWLMINCLRLTVIVIALSFSITLVDEQLQQHYNEPRVVEREFDKD